MSTWSPCTPHTDITCEEEEEEEEEKEEEEGNGGRRKVEGEGEVRSCSIMHVFLIRGEIFFLYTLFLYIFFLLHSIRS